MELGGTVFNSYKQQDYIGALLKMERIARKMGQKEICQGICVVSYLSKIENGKADADPAILEALFQRMGIEYCRDDEILKQGEKWIAEYYHQCEYGLNSTVYEKLQQIETKLLYSYLGLDMRIIVQSENNQGTGDLRACKELMNHRQHLWYTLLLEPEDRDEKSIREHLQECLIAYERFNKSIILISIMDCYYLLSEYGKLHQTATRCNPLALEEGNTYVLARCSLMQGSAYACLNMVDLMLVYYQRTLNLLENTGWKNLTENIYYNMGSVYLELHRYEASEEYLNKTTEDSFLLNHKKALLYIRQAFFEKAEPYLKRMENKLKNSEKSKIEELMYREALFEMEDKFLEKPEYILLLEDLIEALKEKAHFGFIFFYHEYLKKAYCSQRKYRKALELQEYISLKYSENKF